MACGRAAVLSAKGLSLRTALHAALCADGYRPCGRPAAVAEVPANCLVSSVTRVRQWAAACVLMCAWPLGTLHPSLVSVIGLPYRPLPCPLRLLEWLRRQVRRAGRPGGQECGGLRLPGQDGEARVPERWVREPPAPPQGLPSPPPSCLRQVPGNASCGAAWGPPRTRSLNLGCLDTRVFLGQCSRLVVFNNGTVLHCVTILCDLFSHSSFECKI